ncbi:maleylpyruvate isomerase N-terminal domain-containing protein [Streptantibioticus cattleyicolor]|uniref:Mycothiol-dependent maleylpyruvate isomerase metal-binding domain-containing protein n=1 Tax=Streptantibioticus cattleyicolor (strain ATCC 35852 / DSM 46488 / JCM 4925 / NBRC 14057 / NRRL 8057) TaxID=1003195 RepID=F8JMX7_STREN|nr:maleylpyruvate isomerase N-terminal domain-containing protein [Streptantibioticus cattleyicolor]AEW98652.1 hypothetical protein SCATT_p04590 [Streptantibioticus cattleyicolor NRRL 8057 = DSM 46488]CCB72289.1 conserved protein of unknown function [Streptantibioticus cattleyicolor NRRL 8057 = DSM 46488]
MAEVRTDFLALARSAVALLREPAVAGAWHGPSALPGFRVAGLAGHLAYQVLVLPDALAAPEPREETVPLLEHYRRVRWIGAALDEEANVRIRNEGERAAADGPVALADRTARAVDTLQTALPRADDRAVRIPLWGAWSLGLDDMLTTRMMELAVHADDLAVSVGVPTPPLPAGAVDTVIALLSRLAVHRHGPTAVLRALGRAERAPASIAAF